jgi:pimeloyl-ACP methyl ester carboxylesterase
MMSFSQTARWVSVGDGARRLFVGRRAAKESNRPRALLLHGNPASMDDWSNLANEFDGDMELLCPDLPGFGSSDDIEPEGGRTALDTAAECVRAAALHEGWEGPFYVIGHSHGGGVAQALAARHPASIAGIVLIASLGASAHGAYKQLALPGVTNLLGMPARLLKMKAMAPLARTVIRNVMLPMFAPAALPETLVDQQVEAFTKRPSVLVQMARVAKENPSAQLQRNASRVTTPVLIIHGACDKLVPLAHAEELRSLFTQASSVEFHCLQAAGHMVHQTHTADVERLIRAWLARAHRN